MIRLLSAPFRPRVAIGAFRVPFHASIGGAFGLYSTPQVARGDAGPIREEGTSWLSTNPTSRSARAANKKPIMEIGAKLGIPAEDLVPYGHDKAKVSAAFIARQKDKSDGKLNSWSPRSTRRLRARARPPPTVGLGDGLNRIGKKAMICIREASLGPNFGMKGGAAAAANGAGSCRWRR